MVRLEAVSSFRSSQYTHLHVHTIYIHIQYRVQHTDDALTSQVVSPKQPQRPLLHSPTRKNTKRLKEATKQGQSIDPCICMQQGNKEACMQPSPSFTLINSNRPLEPMIDSPSLDSPSLAFHPITSAGFIESFRPWSARVSNTIHTVRTEYGVQYSTSFPWQGLD